MAEIRWLEGATESVVRLESGQALEIGREAGNRLVLGGAGISRRHAHIVPDGDGWAIEDLDSANGVWFNDQQVVRASLRDGDRIRLGESELVFHDDGAPQLPEMVAPEVIAEASPSANDQTEAGYFLTRDGERFGPYSWLELTAYASNGQVAPDDLLWGPGIQEWTAAELIPGLLPTAPAAASALPPLPGPPARRSLKMVFLAAVPVVLLGLVLLVFAAWLGGPGGGGDGDGWQAAVLGLDDDDWQNYPDLKVEQKKIERSMEAFQSALREGDIDEAASWIAEDRRDAYAALFANRPEAMASFAELLESSEMTYFGPPEEPATDFRQRIAEYTVTIDDFDFYLRWAKVDDAWILLDF
jgi:hypothetical protein